MTIPADEALRLMRECYRSAPAAVRKALRGNPNAPLCSSEVPGWSYYVAADSVAYTGHVVGGN